jgi:hypothetical protein
MKWTTTLLVLATTLAAGPLAAAQDEDAIAYDDELLCSYQGTLVFERNSVVVNLDAQGQLNQSLQWLLEVPGRYLLVLGADGPGSADVRLGVVRVRSVAAFLSSSGAPWASLLRDDFGRLRTTRLHSGLRSYEVVLMGCEISPVVSP